MKRTVLLAALAFWAAAAFAGGQKTAPELSRGQVVLVPNAPLLQTELQLPPASPLVSVVSGLAAPAIETRALETRPFGAPLGFALSPARDQAHAPSSLTYPLHPSRDGSVDKSAPAAARGLQAPLAAQNVSLTKSLENPSAGVETVSLDARAEFDGDKKDEGSAPASSLGGAGGSRPALKRGRKLATGALTAAALLLASATPAFAHGGAGAQAPAADGVGIAAGLLGLALGMRHALDPDHVIALLNIVTGAESRWKGWRLGALWGLGHSLSLLVVGGGVILAKTAIPENLGAALESLVALMLIGLGAASIIREKKTAAHGHYHDLGAMRLKPFFIGLVHGLAGSGAVALLALAAVPGAVAGFLYLGAFGLGTILGMSVVTLFIQALAVRLVSDPKVRGRVAVAAGLLSAAFGAYMLAALVPLLLGS